MMNIDLDELERLARAATPGEWTDDKNCNIWVEQREFHQQVTLATVYRSKLFEDWQKQAEADAAYIAAANPAVVLALIERLRQAEAALHSLITGEANPSLREWLNKGGTEETWYIEIAQQALEADKTKLTTP